jgi:hypothetical protein
MRKQMVVIEAVYKQWNEIATKRKSAPFVANIKAYPERFCVRAWDDIINRIADQRD